ncbi:hypothetical protein QFC19_006311 [Naganishia cerealis]|uniref:Uncharacterized protein n=1 Tax=Naganishia cerealis TaxID=610337 RepID=A0ACC2VGP7_9TREE|nr:hypothetical protein QFC19_006311 [Naganishia cerealis]
MRDLNEIVDSLKPFSSCEVSDALVRLGVQHGGYLSDIRAFSPMEFGDAHPKLIGPATTVEIVHASTELVESPQGHHVSFPCIGLISYGRIDLARPGRVMVITAPADCNNAIWGGLMSAAAKSKGLIGVVLNGRCRDIAEHRSLGFPVFAKAQSTLGQNSFTKVSAIDQPIHIPNGAGLEITVNPEDIIVADEDGVVVIPLKLLEQAVAIMAVAAEQNARCMEDLINGHGVGETFKKHR